MSAAKCETLGLGLFRLDDYTFYAPNVVTIRKAPKRDAVTVFTTCGDDPFTIDAPVDEAVHVWSLALSQVVRR
jgi:hypothetical protein